MTAPWEGAAAISVVVPTYNRAQYLPQCLDSLLAQTVPAAEIIVVDDGSTDDTQAVVARYTRRQPKVTYLCTPNGGKPRAVNLGVARARGDWIWILDDDDSALPEANALRLAALAESGDDHGPDRAAFVYAGHRLAGDGANRELVITGEHRPDPPHPARLFVALAQSCFFHLGSALVRRDVFNGLGGLDPDLRTGEDYDFQIRLARAHDGVFCPHPVFVFRCHAGERGSAKDRYRAEQRSAAFRRDSRTIGRQLRRDTELERFAQHLHAQASNTPHGELTAVALRERMIAMGNHGCLSEMLQDIRELLLLRAGEGRGPAPDDLRAMAASMRAGWAYEAANEDWPGFLRALHHVTALPGGRAAGPALARGVLWLAHHQARGLRCKTNLLLRAASLAAGGKP